ncbi:MAG: VWA domain-containing protein [Phycisphaerae bacterium]|nr:VWA domain-containing protein [Phycisphaerae bacterium]
MIPTQRKTASTSLVILICAAAAHCLPLSVAHANGLIISPISESAVATSPPERRPIHSWMPFQIKNQIVDVTITEAVAESTVEQVFVNRSGSPQEGQYLFPIAENAGVHRFTMWMNGKEVVGEMLDADRARSIYESIVSRTRDPGLLQFAGRGLIQAKVFPIPPNGECRIKLKYTEPVTIDSGLASYRFPLGSAGGRFEPIEQFSLRATVRTERPLISVFSASDQCSVDRRSEKEIVVSIERQRHAPESDFQLFAQLGMDAFGLSMLPYRMGEDEGFFMARISPRVTSRDDAIQPKNICFVLDTSGSMADSNKIAQARKAMQFCVTNLHPEDRFNVITFSTEIRSFRESWAIATDAERNAACQFIDRASAVGGTDINAALARALSMRPTRSETDGATEAWKNNPYLIVFITDGEPTVGVTNLDEILANAAAANVGKSARIFSLGVGFQVNTKLLDRLSDDNGGTRDYVTPDENLELKISAFYTKLANPVLSDVSLAFDGVSVQDLYPRQIPDLFHGGEIVVVGRYSGAKESQQIRLSGTARGEKRSYNYACRFPTQDSRNEFLPRFWAMRKIGFLLDELRLHGDNLEIRNEVIRLSKLYGILTPYTSFLVQEDEHLALREDRAPVGGRAATPQMRQMRESKDDEYAAAARGQAAAVGKESNKQSQVNYIFRGLACDAATQQESVLIDSNRDNQGRRLINFVGPRTFYLEDGRWVDATYDGKAETVKVVIYSKDYFDLINTHRELASCFAQSERVVVKCGGKFIETVLPSTQKAEPPSDGKNGEIKPTGA